MNYQVGDTLYYVPDHSVRRSGTPHFVTIDKVGRTWLTVSNKMNQRRINKETLYADGQGYSSPGRCYRTESEYNESIQRIKLWCEIKNIVNALSNFDHLSLEDMQMIHDKLSKEVCSS